MTHDRNALVWYAAYGSNLCRERFLRYLSGGPVAGSTMIQTGGRDPAEPRHDRAHPIDRTLYFAGSSRSWGGGGVAYLDADEVPATPTLGRIWLITVGQLEDVYGQENREPEVPRIDLQALAEIGELTLSTGPYGRLVRLEEIDDLPVITFTAASRRLDHSEPHRCYRDVIARGLRESWGLDPSEVDEYLAGLPQSRLGSTP
jgi:hypothetical protein